MIKATRILLYLLHDEGIKVELTQPSFQVNSDIFIHANDILRMWNNLLEKGQVEAADVVIEYEDGHKFRIAIVLSSNLDLLNIKDSIISHLEHCLKLQKTGDTTEKTLASKAASEIHFLASNEYQMA